MSDHFVIRLIKRLFWPAMAIMVAIILWAAVVHPDYIVDGPPQATLHRDQVPTEKYDGDCPTDTTDGRCADKCPTGSYLQGYKDDGVAICKTDVSPECPYAAAVQAGTPECDRLQSEQAHPATPITTYSDPATDDIGGGK